jgi:hypothetical protein
MSLLRPGKGPFYILVPQSMRQTIRFAKEPQLLVADCGNGGVSRETVKSQMKAVLAKTGIRRQGELIGLASRLPGLPD